MYIRRIIDRAQRHTAAPRFVRPLSTVVSNRVPAKEHKQNTAQISKNIVNHIDDTGISLKIAT